jgi:hypothetical protein
MGASDTHIAKLNRIESIAIIISFFFLYRSVIVQIYYGLGLICMNNRTTSRMSLFIIAAALLTAVTTTTTVGMVPAAYAGGDDDDDRKSGDGNGNKHNDKDQKDRDGNKQQVEEESAGILADCDTNDVDSIYICSAISPQCRPDAVCVWGQIDPTLTALPISWR